MMKRILLIAVSAIVIAGCTDNESVLAVGTLERERAHLRAPMMERIDAKLVDDGASVREGEALIRFDTRVVETRLARAAAEMTQAERRLDELVRGPRSERILEAEARLAGAQSRLENAQKELARVQPLLADALLPQSAEDNAETARDAALSDRNQARAALEALLEGTTVEELDQARAALEAARAAHHEQQLLLEQLTVNAPFDGVAERVYVEPGDRPPAGTEILTLEKSGAPFLRVFLPADARKTLAVGDTLTVRVDGHGEYAGRIRFISPSASYTPYYALREEDRGRLSYLAEIQLGENAANLSTGLPAEVMPAGAQP